MASLKKITGSTTGNTMSMDLHNIQINLALIPRAHKIIEPQEHLLANGAQIINVVQQHENDRKLKQVQEFDECQATAAEDSDQRRLKHKEEDKQRRGKQRKKEGKIIDLYG